MHAMFAMFLACDSLTDVSELCCVASVNKMSRLIEHSRSLQRLCRRALFVRGWSFVIVRTVHCCLVSVCVRIMLTSDCTTLMTVNKMRIHVITKVHV